jgi:hypothetical protein
VLWKIHEKEEEEAEPEEEEEEEEEEQQQQQQPFITKTSRTIPSIVSPCHLWA